MSNEFTVDELRQELERREKEGITVSEPSIVDRYLGGFLKNVEAAGAGIYGSVANPVSAVQGLVSSSTPINEQMGVDEGKYQQNTTAYRFAEGAFPAAIGGFAVGNVPGAIAGGIAGGLTNVAAKQIFPESPLGQAAVSLLPGIPSAMSRLFKGKAPDVPTARPDPETDVLLSPGQRSGSPAQLLKEEGLRGDVKTATIVSNFDRAQQAKIDEFTQSIQNLRNQLPPEKLRDVIASRYDTFNKEIINNFKRSNNQAFSAATSIKGDVVPTDNVKNAVDDLIRQYNNPDVPGNAAVLNNLMKIRQKLSQMTGSMILGPNGQPMVQTQGAKISIERLKQSLSAWSDTAYKGQFSDDGVTAFEDISPGVAKGIARRVLNAYRDDLDEAVKSGIPGADLLKNARNQYAVGLKKIDDVANQPVNKYVTSARFEKAPEKILEDIVKMRPSERVEMATVLGRDYPDVYDTVRAKAMSDILSKYRSGEGFDLRGLFRDQPFGGENAWIFGSKAEQSKVTGLMQALEQINRKTKATEVSTGNIQAGLRAGAETAGVAGGAVAKYGLQAVIDSFRYLASRGADDPQKLAYMFFTPNGRQIIQELAKPNPNPKYLTREAYDGLLMGVTSAASQARDTSYTPPEPTPSFSLEDLEAEARRRGMR
jgi:hypothetical protein